MVGDDVGRIIGEDVTERAVRGIGMGIAGEWEIDPERL